MKISDQWTYSVTETSGQGRALEWAALILNRPEIRNESANYVQNALIDWWNCSAEWISAKLAEFPEPFRTTGFRKEIHHIENPLAALKPAFDSLRAGESSLFEAMDHLGRNFAWDAERLMRWKEGLEHLSALALWLPVFTPALDYLNIAFPLGREEIDRCRESLLQSVHEPHRFLEAGARDEFSQKFLEFKKNYMEAYCLLHEDALNIVGGMKKDELKIDPVLLRNLDLLSDLQYVDKSYLNKVKLLAKWVQRNQCNLPLQQILERYPRCYCNFNPSSQQHPSDSVAQINGIIREGIDYFRTLLRRCGHLITSELKAQETDERMLQPIVALLGDGPPVPLKPQSIKILNRIIRKYPNEFLAEIRRIK
ncbi:MAG: hypothetical protein JXA73_14940 [Acidobacteria bacterium]|nr:hypothetical protein [Acidobacteriota bacterium]